MSAGTLVSLGVHGPQCAHLISPSELTFWKAHYPRHTNFAVTELQIPFCSNTGYGRSRMMAKMSRAGDLLSQLYMYDEIAPITYDGTPGSYDVTATPIAASWYTDGLGHAKIIDAEIQIGQHPFDRHTGEYMEIMDCLFSPAEKGLDKLVGKYPTTLDRVFAGQNTQRLYTPFRFWFCRFYEQALPIIALYWHDVNLIINQRPLSELYHSSGGAVGHTVVPDAPRETYIIGMFVYLDKIERGSFANGKHEYIFDQVQYLGEETHPAASTVQQHSVRFNHPVQEILWVCQKDDVVVGGPNIVNGQGGNNWFDFSGVDYNESGTAGAPLMPTHPFERAIILLNNHERTIDHFADYYKQVQQWEKHTRLSPANRWIYGYSFGLRPENLLDTGSTNMSRLDQAVVKITYPTVASGRSWTGRTRFYGRSRNLAKSTVGMMGIKYAA